MKEEKVYNYRIEKDWLHHFSSFEDENASCIFRTFSEEKDICKTVVRWRDVSYTITSKKDNSTLNEKNILRIIVETSQDTHIYTSFSEFLEKSKKHLLPYNNFNYII